MQSRFIGIDLAWKPDVNPTGAVVLSGTRSGAEVADVASDLRSFTAVLEYIEQHSTDETVVAVDAPLIIPNSTGQRRCDHALSRAYGSRQASCHSANQTLLPNAASVRLEAELQTRGYRHISLGSRTMLEVYPHAALVSLFDLPHIIKYKKGRVESKRSGLRELQSRLRTLNASEARLCRVARGCIPAHVGSRDAARPRTKGVGRLTRRSRLCICGFSPLVLAGSANGSVWHDS